MNKKCLSVAISIFMLVSMVDITFAAKKDVADPVLQEIISELSDKMPRFINKYGAAVFVADEQITRGSLLQALYEFDKKTSSSRSAASTASAAGVITKKEYDTLNAKVNALERKIQNGASSKSSGGESVDIVDIMNDLELNMPMLLDNTLSSSKVFKDLEAKVKAVGAGGTVSGSGVSQTALVGMQKNINDLTKKMDNFEISLASVKQQKQNGKDASVSQTALAGMQKNINDLTKKVDEISLAGTKQGGKDSSLSQKELAALKKNISDLTAKVDNVEFLVANVNTKQDGKNTGVSQTALAGVQKNINDLTKKVDNMETTLASVKQTGGSASSATLNAKALYEIKNFKSDIETVNKKISDMETKLASSKSSSSVSNSPSQEEVNNLKKTIVQMQKSYVTLGKRLDSMEKEQSLIASSSNNSSSSSALSAAQMKLINTKINSIREEVDNIKVDTSKISQNDKSSADIKKIEKRLSNLESNKTSTSSSGSKDSGSSKTSTVAKVSLGLSLVAALFIAR